MFRKLPLMLDRARPASEHITKREKDFPKSNYMEVMIMRIQHNIMALNSNRQLGVNNSAVAKSLEKLSSGYRINRDVYKRQEAAISRKKPCWMLWKPAISGMG